MAEFHQGAREQSKHGQRRQTNTPSFSLSLNFIRLPLVEDASAQSSAQYDLVDAAFVLAVLVISSSVVAPHRRAVGQLG